jgi:hypothetical protein
VRIPVIRGLIDRRILVNFRVAPSILAGWLPDPFRPKLVNGFGVAGICLIRLKHLRPRFAPRFVGTSSENAAHRLAVQWDHDGETHEGVYIPRRDTSSRLNTLAGGRLFPGVHHHARFRVSESDDEFGVVMDSDDGTTHVAAHGRTAAKLSPGSIFPSLEDASEFFERGSVGYSATRAPGTFDGLELRAFTWQVMPLAVDRVESSFFEDGERFPPGAAEFDCALLMRGIEHEWHGRKRLCLDRVVSKVAARNQVDPSCCPLIPSSAPCIVAAWRSDAVQIRHGGAST